MSWEDKEMDNAERLAVVETELKQLNKSVMAMNDKLDVWNQNFVPRNEINVMFDHRDQEIKSIKQNLTEQEQNKWSLRRIWPAWLGVVIAVFSLMEKFM